MESENKISYLIQQGFVNLYFSDTCKLWHEICYLLHYHPAIHGVLQCPYWNHMERLKRRLCILYSEDLGIYIFQDTRFVVCLLRKHKTAIYFWVIISNLCLTGGTLMAGCLNVCSTSRGSGEVLIWFFIHRSCKEDCASCAVRIWAPIFLETHDLLSVCRGICCYRLFTWMI